MYTSFSQPKGFVALIPEAFRLYFGAFWGLIIPMVVFALLLLFQMHGISVPQGGDVVVHQPGVLAVYSHHFARTAIIAIINVAVTAYMFLKLHQVATQTQAFEGGFVKAWLKKLPVFFCTIILALVISLVGLALFVLPGIYFYPLVPLMYCAVLFEKASVFGSVKRAFQLIKGCWWRVFGASILFLILFVVVLMVFSMLMGVVMAMMHYHPQPGAAHSILGMLPILVFLALAIPLLYTYHYLIYRNLTLIKGGVDHLG